MIGKLYAAAFDGAFFIETAGAARIGEAASLFTGELLQDIQDNEDDNDN